MLDATLKALIEEADRRMEVSHETFKNDLKTLRSSRANPAILDGVIVEAYGDKMRINQLANVSIQNKTSLLISVWAKENVSSIRKAIVDSNLGLNPMAENTTIMITMPEMTTERRNQLALAAKDYAERAKVNVRNVRRKFLNQIRDLKKSSEVSEDGAEVAEKELGLRADKVEEAIAVDLKKKEAEIHAT